MTALAGLLAQVDGDGWDHMGGWGGGWMRLWSVVMMVLIVWLVRATTGTSPPDNTGRRDPLDRGRESLVERYARGELSKEEYRNRVQELR